MTTTTIPPTGIAHMEPDAPVIQPELLTTQETAKLCGIGGRTLWRWSRCGITPPPVHIGGAVRYRRSQYLAWIASGCPRGDGGAGR